MTGPSFAGDRRDPRRRRLSRLDWLLVSGISVILAAFTLGDVWLWAAR